MNIENELTHVFTQAIENAVPEIDPDIPWVNTRAPRMDPRIIQLNAEIRNLQRLLKMEQELATTKLDVALWIFLGMLLGIFFMLILTF